MYKILGKTKVYARNTDLEWENSRMFEVTEQILEFRWSYLSKHPSSWP